MAAQLSSFWRTTSEKQLACRPVLNLFFRIITAARRRDQAANYELLQVIYGGAEYHQHGLKNS